MTRVVTGTSDATSNQTKRIAGDGTIPGYDYLASVLSQGAQPSVALIEGGGLLPGARFLCETVRDARRDRLEWHGRLLAAADGMDLVFLDPDNGMEVPSKGPGRKGSSKYAMWL